MLGKNWFNGIFGKPEWILPFLLYTSHDADQMNCVDHGGSRII